MKNIINWWLAKWNLRLEANNPQPQNRFWQVAGVGVVLAPAVRTHNFSPDRVKFIVIPIVDDHYVLYSVGNPIGVTCRDDNQLEKSIKSIIPLNK